MFVSAQTWKEGELQIRSVVSHVGHGAAQGAVFDPEVDENFLPQTTRSGRDRQVVTTLLVTDDPAPQKPRPSPQILLCRKVQQQLRSFGTRRQHARSVLSSSQRGPYGHAQPVSATNAPGKSRSKKPLEAKDDERKNMADSFSYIFLQFVLPIMSEEI